MLFSPVCYTAGRVVLALSTYQVLQSCSADAQSIGLEKHILPHPTFQAPVKPCAVGRDPAVCSD
jgi:hypothetical protein